MSDMRGTALSVVMPKTGQECFRQGLRRAFKEIDIEDVVDDWFQTQGNFSAKNETTIYGLLDRMDLNKNGFLTLEEFYRLLDPKGTGDGDLALYFDRTDAEAFLGPQPVYVADFESLDGHSHGADCVTWKSGYTLLQSLVTFLQEDNWFGKIEVRPEVQLSQRQVGPTAATVVQDESWFDIRDGQVNSNTDPDHPLNETEKQEESSEKFVEVDEFGLAAEETPGLLTAADVRGDGF